MRRSLIQGQDRAALNYMDRIHRLDEACHFVEDEINRLLSQRHEYPIWPPHNRQLDIIEREMHEPVRKMYYDNIYNLIYLARKLRGG